MITRLPIRQLYIALQSSFNEMILYSKRQMVRVFKLIQINKKKCKSIPLMEEV